MYTRDGSTWRRLLQNNDYGFAAMQYLGGGIGFAVSDGLYQTTDHGRHWRQTKMPVTGQFGIDQMRFAGKRQGYIAGCLDRRMVTLATPDAGKSWFKAELPAPAGDPRWPACALQTDGLLVINEREAWLLGVQHSFGLHDTQGEARVWRTADGGHRWGEVYRSHWPVDLGEPVPGSAGTFLSAPAVAFTGPFVLGKFIVLFKDTQDSTGELLYTSDQGQHWSSAPLHHFITGCAQAPSALVCAANTYPDFGLATITLGR
jgi:photosystem II stability/assembly factor-like uncharacterized protein